MTPYTTFDINSPAEQHSRKRLRTRLRLRKDSSHDQNNVSIKPIHTLMLKTVSLDIVKKISQSQAGSQTFT